MWTRTKGGLGKGLWGVMVGGGLHNLHRARKLNNILCKPQKKIVTTWQNRFVTLPHPKFARLATFCRGLYNPPPPSSGLHVNNSNKCLPMHVSHATQICPFSLEVGMAFLSRRSVQKLITCLLWKTFYALIFGYRNEIFQ